MIATIVKQLSIEINRRGAVYKLVRRGKQTLIYGRTVGGETRSYEIFRIRVRKAGVIKGKLTPSSEIYPHNEVFGTWGKVSYSIDRAILIFNEFENGSA